MVFHFEMSMNCLQGKCLIDTTFLLMRQTTVSNYSVQCLLPIKFFEYFQSRHEETYESHLLAFKLMLESEMKRQREIEIADI